MRRIPWLSLLTLVGVMMMEVTASASAAPATVPAAVAITSTAGVVAIGQFVGGDGPVSTLDLRASTRLGRTLGTLRFFCPMFGYYNGVVRTLTVENGVISVAGGGGLVKPDGTRHLVRFSATIVAATRAVTLTIEGANGLRYHRSGTLEPGLVRLAPPASAAHP